MVLGMDETNYGEQLETACGVSIVLLSWAWMVYTLVEVVLKGGLS